jgi:hypothetical protein
MWRSTYPSMTAVTRRIGCSCEDSPVIAERASVHIWFFAQ